MNRIYSTTAVRDAVAKRLTECPEIVDAGATVVARERGRLISDIQQTIARLKLAVVVTPCEIVRVNANTIPPVIEELRVTVAVSESRLNDGPEGEELAELILLLLHGEFLPEVGPECVLYADDGPVTYDETPTGLAVSRLSFRCLGLPAQPVQAP